MRRGYRPVAALLLLALAACGAPPVSRTTTPDLIFVVVRHAEKRTDDPRDPTLSDAGQARAAALAQRFRSSPLTAAYATGFRRTQETAGPAAKANGIILESYDAATPPAEFVTHLRDTHTQGRVLVVGHSNTVPDIVAQLCACTVAPIDEATYGQLFEVRIDGNGDASLVESRF